MFYHLTYGVGSKIHSRWLVTYDIRSDGTLVGLDVRGNNRVVGRAMPYSIAEKSELPEKIRGEADDQVLESERAAERGLEA